MTLLFRLAKQKKKKKKQNKKTPKFSLLTIPYASSRPSRRMCPTSAEASWRSRLSTDSPSHNRTGCLQATNLNIDLYIRSWKLVSHCICSFVLSHLKWLQMVSNINKMMKTTASKDSSTSSKSPRSRKVTNVTVESFASSLIATEQPMSPWKANYTINESPEW